MKTALLIALTLLPASLNAALFNSQFEDPEIWPQTTKLIQPGENGIANWQVTDGSVTLWRIGPFAGQALELNGTERGAVQQAIAGLVPGELHQIELQFAPSSPDGFQGFAIYWNSNLMAIRATNPPEELELPPSALLSYVSFRVIPTGTDMLRFESINDGTEGFLIDNITLTYVPEPRTYATVFALALFSFAALRRVRTSKS
jgi:hypothetical protein